MSRSTTGADVASGFRPALVSWNLTQRCNLRCPHCYLSAGKKAAAELTTAECLAVMDELTALGTEMVILTGGEPLLRRDIHDLARAAAERGLWVVMGTNGVLLDRRVATAMVDCGVKGVAVSIDSIDPARHDAFRGGPGSWQHAVRALEVAREAGLEVLVQTTVTPENRDEVPALLEFAAARGAWSFNLYFLVRTGRGEGMEPLDAAATEALLGEMVEAQDAHRPMLVRSKCAPQFKRIAHQRGRGGLESGGCMAGTQYCRITPEGDVTPCPYMTASAGNLRQRSFTEIWTESPLLLSLRDPDRLGGRCGACEYRELCGGCRCRAYADLGDVLAEDPACPYEPTGIPLATDTVAWSAAARARLDRIPIAFIRGKVERGVEAFARRHGVALIDESVMEAGLAGATRPAAFGVGDRPS